MKHTLFAALGLSLGLTLTGAAAGFGGLGAPMLSGSLASAALSSGQSSGQFSGLPSGAIYMRTKGTAVVRNFPDENGSALATIAPGTIVRAYRSSSGKPVFREVEIAGGFPVWVFGAYLQPTDVEDVLMVTGSRVNMRPLPELSPAAMALRSKLDSGDRVLMLARANKSAKFSEDWVRIQAPARAKAWITDAALEAIGSAEGKIGWSTGTKALPTTPRVRSAARPASASTGGAGAKASSTTYASPVTSEVIRALADADKAFAAADELEFTPAEAWEDVVAAYGTVLEGAPAGSITHQNASLRMEDARMKLELATLREDLVAGRERRDEEVRQIDEYLEHQKRKRTAKLDRYEERGWLESRNVGGQRRWYLVFAGATVAEVRCMSQRYQLEVFDGFEIGVIGHEVVPVVQATQTSLAEARIVDIQRIEVISAKGRL